MESTTPIDREILLKLNIKEIKTLCSTGERFSILCQDLNFWNEYYLKHRLPPFASFLDLIERDLQSQRKKKAKNLLDELVRKAREGHEEIEETGEEEDYVVNLFDSSLKITGQQNLMKLSEDLLPKDLIGGYEEEVFHDFLNELRSSQEQEDDEFELNIYFEDEPEYESDEPYYQINMTANNIGFEPLMINYERMVNIITKLFEMGVNFEINP